MKKTFILTVLFLFIGSGFIYANSGTMQAKKDASIVVVKDDITNVAQDGDGPFNFFKKIKNKVQEKVNKYKNNRITEKVNKFKKRLNQKIYKVKEKYKIKDGDSFMKTLYNFLMIGIIFLALGLIFIILAAGIHEAYGIIGAVGAILFLTGAVLLILAILGVI